MLLKNSTSDVVEVFNQNKIKDRNMKKLLSIVIMLLFVTVISQAQLTKGKSYLGPAVGLGFDNSTLTLGANYEYAIDKNIAVGGVFRLNTWSEDFLFWEASYTNIFIGAQGNYHFDGLIKDTKWDPYAGLVLGFNSYSSSVSYKTGSSSGYSDGGSGGLFFSAHATMRYWVNPGLGVQARLEFGSQSSSNLMLGVDFVF